MILIFFLLPFFSKTVWSAGPDICEVLNLKNCSGITKQGRRSTQHSFPSPATAASTNPASVSFDRGFGLEMLVQANNPVGLSVATGTGKMGGALLSPALENIFFGNRIVEIDEDYFNRRLDDQQYQNNKLSLAIGGKLTDKKSVGLDVGLLLKRHFTIKRVNPGVGLSGRLGLLNFGGSVYQDDLLLKLRDHIDPVTGLPYSQIYNDSTYQEKFTVQTYTLGAKIKNFALDVGHISAKYNFNEEDSRIYLYSASFNHQNFLLNYAIRNERSGTPDFKNKMLIKQNLKVEKFWSVQYSINQHIIFGINYNYFLLDEASLSLTIFL